MNKVNSFQRGAAAGAALLVTLAVVWGLGIMGYPTPAESRDGIAASTNAQHCRS